MLWEDGTSFDYAGAESMEREIARLAPDDLPGYARFVEYTRRVFERGYEELAAPPFSNVSDMLRVLPSLVRLRADRSVYATVARFVKDERLREALSFHSLLVGGNPFDTSAIYTLIHYLERKWASIFRAEAPVPSCALACASSRSSEARCASRAPCAVWRSSAEPECAIG